ncbi:alpha/beta fold hydrolase [Salinirarus marinus]|uniref:alpha/beta fold hydrolase n=1 Tax=Salinirarus marinus TaxID=3068310 RepID=UPI003C6CB225
MASEASGTSADDPVDKWARRAARLVEQLPRLASVDVGVTESHTVYSENKLDLRRYGGEGRPLVLVYALVNRPDVLDLSPARSVVRTLRTESDVYLVDWGDPSPLDGSLSLSDYVTRYLDNCVDAVRDRTGASQVDLLGYCMGGTMATMYAALEPEKVRRLGQLAAPLAFDGAGGVLERWATGVDPRALADDRGLVPADTLDACFRLVDPVENYVATYRRLLENVDDDAFVERFGRVEQWLRDGVDVPAAVFAEFVEACYRRDALRTGALTLDGRRIDPSRLTMPVAQIVGARDTLVPPAATREFADVVPGPVTPFEADVGHVGLAVSADAHDDLWPRVAAWYD